MRASTLVGSLRASWAENCPLTQSMLYENQTVLFIMDSATRDEKQKKGK